MSHDSNPQNDTSKELRILDMMKKTLTGIAKDTQTPPGMRHPLSDHSILNIRDCLNVIVAREAELAELSGKDQSLRPRFTDEPQDKVVVRFDPKPDLGR